MRVLVTGGAGFIGSHLVERFVGEGHDVHVLDNLSTGRKAFIDAHLSSGAATLHVGDCMRPDDVRRAMDGADLVVHAAANADIRTAVTDPRDHVDQNVVATWNVLEAAKEVRPETLLFTSTSTVYGEAEVLPTPEHYAPMEPISLYGAAKLASEALICAACHSFELEAVCYRFANVVGPRATHGVIVDFIRKLRADPTRLEILGDGSQTKSYVHVADCVDGMLAPIGHAGRRRPFDAFNIGTRQTTNVTRIAEVVIETLGLEDVSLDYTGGVDGGRGWIGDVKRMSLDSTRLEALGWSPASSSDEAVAATAAWVAANWDAVA